MYFFNEIVFFNVPGKREKESEQDKTEKGKSESNVLFWNADAFGEDWREPAPVQPCGTAPRCTKCIGR